MKNLITLVFLITLSFAVQSEEKESLKKADWYYSKLEQSVESVRANVALNKSILEHNQAKFKHREALMKYKERAYDIQQIMTVIVFVIVAALVIGGAWLSYRQFLLDAESQQNAKDRGEAPKSAIRLSKDGVEFSSSVIGLMMLFMSFFFFYLYVSEVYTIKHNELKPLSIIQPTQDDGAQK